MTRMDLRTMLTVAEEMPGDPHVNDYGALIAAEARHAGTVLGDDVYPSLAAKAAALLHSLVRVEALDVRNQTFAWMVASRYMVLNNTPPPKVDPASAMEAISAARRGDWAFTS
jgi:death on curing protein